MPKPSAPTDLATQQQIYLERIKAGFVKDWDSVQESLRVRVREVLTALEVDSLGELDKRALNKVLVKLQNAHLSVTTSGILEFSKELEELAGLASSMEVTGLSALVGTGYKFNRPTAKLAYARALAEPIQATGELLEPFLKDWPALDSKRLVGIVRTGWAQDKPLMEMIRELVGTRKQKYKNGKLELTRRDAGAIIHTATQHTANAARMKTWEDNNDLVIGYTWVSTLDSHTTPTCRSLDGREFEPGKGPMPPIHIRCRSTTAPKLSPEYDFLDEDATRAASGPNGGPVDADETYYPWLKRQPYDFQKKAIGPTRAKLLKDGGLTAEEFAKLNLNKNFEPLTLAEMKDLEPEAFKRAKL